MYWPAGNGSPNIYALSKQARGRGNVRVSHDGVDEGALSTSDGDPSQQGEERAADLQASRSSSRSGRNSDGVKEKRDQDSQSATEDNHEIIAAKVSRGGSLFATATRSTLTVWQTKPTLVLASIIRSPQSLQSYGPTTALLMRPDSLLIVLQTSSGYLITYTLATDPNTLVYQTQFPSTTKHRRRDSEDGYQTFTRASHAYTETGPGEANGIAEVSLRFRMVIRIDAGISSALALDHELVVATQKPVALQTIKWVADESGSQWSTELLSRMPWVEGKGVCIVDMVHDRPMNLSCWITDDGKAYAVQRRKLTTSIDGQAPSPGVHGFCFRAPETNDHTAVRSAINARFSLIAVACANGAVDVYTVKDYTGNIPLSHRLVPPASASMTGKLTHLSYSPDGYCLLSGYERGWALWSVYGKAGTNTFSSDRSNALRCHEAWLLNGVQDAFWIGGGCELALLPHHDDSLYVLDMARSAATSCLSAANISRGLLQSSTSITVYKGHDIGDLTSLSADAALWSPCQIPHNYLAQQWPIKCSVISPDGHYVAVAGRRGLAHYSIASGRWKCFDDPAAEMEFVVRGGMCWWQHYLIAAVEIDRQREWQLRVFSREKSLEFGKAVHVEEVAAPIILIATSGTDSLLVYTHDNLLLHYIILPNGSSIKLVQVGQIGFHGIIRAPPRVRAISWILPEDQLEQGDPSQDVATASVIFLVDAKLVLLQPTLNEDGGLKYDMRVIAHNVEYYMLLRDQPNAYVEGKLGRSAPSTPMGLAIDDHLGHSLRDSLWYFDGSNMLIWPDVLDMLSHAPVELGRDLPPTISVSLDFYPLGPMVSKGIIHGLDAELAQRQDVNFSIFRHRPRTTLFLPQVLRHHLTEFNSPAALHLSSSYQHLPYFAHALEVLLHDVLDAEVDNPPSPPETALLPGVVSFLSSFPCYLDVIVNCTRKTELRSWRTLFANLPPVMELFEQSLSQGKLKTAAGYLLVLHTFATECIESPASPSRQDREAELEVREFARLLRAAVQAGEWELCRELARFLVGIDSSGQTLRSTLGEAGLTGHDEATSYMNGRVNGNAGDRRQSLAALVHGGESQHATHVNGTTSVEDRQDYFSLGRPPTARSAARQQREQHSATLDA